MPASSITSTVRALRVFFPRSQLRSRLASVREVIPEDSSNPSAALPASAAPLTS